MDGIHDLGGMQGFGAVDVEADEPVFHHAWEGHVFALTGAAMGAGGFNTPMFRHAIERMDPAHYLASGYYEHWLTAAATLLVEHGIVGREELEAGAGRFALSRPVAAAADAAGAEPAGSDARYATGDEVRVRRRVFSGHTRCPAYVRGRRGTVVRVDGAFPVPEIEAHRREKLLETTYSVRFDGEELWPGEAEPGTSVAVDLYEHHLEPA